MLRFVVPCPFVIGVSAGSFNFSFAINYPWRWSRRRLCHSSFLYNPCSRVGVFRRVDFRAPLNTRNGWNGPRRTDTREAYGAFGAFLSPMCGIMTYMFIKKEEYPSFSRFFPFFLSFSVARSVKLAYIRSIFKSHNAPTPFISGTRMSESIVKLMALPSHINPINIPRTGSECHTGGEEHDKVPGSVGTPEPPLAIRRQARGLTRQVARLTSFPTP